MADVVEVLRNALCLPARDRAALAEKLLASLEELNEETERLWAEEAKRRLDAYRGGAAKVTPAGELHRKVETLSR